MSARVHFAGGFCGHATPETSTDDPTRVTCRFCLGRVEAAAGERLMTAAGAAVVIAELMHAVAALAASPRGCTRGRVLDAVSALRGAERLLLARLGALGDDGAEVLQ